MQYTPQLPRLASRIDGSSSCSIRCRISLIKPWEYRISGAFYHTMENIVCNSVWASHKSRWAFDCSVNTIDDDNERKSADLVICKVNARHEFGVRIWDMSFLCCGNTGHGSSFFMLLADSRFGFDLEKAHLWWHCRFASWCVNHPSANAFGKALFDWFFCTIEFVIVVKNEPADDSTQSLNQAHQTQCTPYHDWFTTYTLYILTYYKWRAYMFPYKFKCVCFWLCVGMYRIDLPGKVEHANNGYMSDRFDIQTGENSWRLSCDTHIVCMG